MAADVGSLDAILNAMYEVISGPVGERRDWERFRNLYAPGARLMPVISPPGAAARVRVLTPEEYIRRVEPIFAQENFWSGDEPPDGDFRQGGARPQFL
jgi:hypothetical protein